MSVGFDGFEALTFDCYGTLIDWEAGLLAALRKALPSVDAADEELLEEYAAHEVSAEGGPYLSYRGILGSCLRSIATTRGVAVSGDVVAEFSESVRDWPAFPDSTDALRRLGQRYRLGVVTNCDTDLFAASSERLGVEFDWVVTAEQAGSYKPSLRPFELALEQIALPRERILHVAQSLFHDHVPAKQLGLTSVWIDRRGDRPGFGATPPADATPDAAYPSMAAFAAAAA